MDTFYFGRLNYSSDAFTYGNYDEKNKFLLQLLETNFRFRPRKKLNYQYGIFDLLVIDDYDLGTIYTGELIKYQDLKEEEVVKEGRVSSEYIKSAVLGKSRFFLLEKSHLIAYNPYGNIISSQAFCEAFVGILIGGDDSFKVDADIYPINYKYEFMAFLKSMRTLSNLNITLTPSNPDNRDYWKEVDERLIDMNVKKYQETYDARDNESLEIDENIEVKVVMAQDGYGKATGKGTDADGNQVEISTESKESITKKSIKKDLTISEQFERIRKVFVDVIERFKRE